MLNIVMRKFKKPRLLFAVLFALILLPLAGYIYSMTSQAYTWRADNSLRNETKDINRQLTSYGFSKIRSYQTDCQDYDDYDKNVKVKCTASLSTQARMTDQFNTDWKGNSSKLEALLKQRGWRQNQITNKPLSELFIADSQKSQLVVFNKTKADYQYCALELSTSSRYYESPEILIANADELCTAAKR